MFKPVPTSRRSFLKQLGAAALTAPFVTQNLLAQPPGRVMRHASFGTGGMAWHDLQELAKCPGVEIVALCDVDLRRTVEARKRFPNARVYQDWRELLDREAGHIDSVNVSTPDHMHAPIAVSAMQLGKHVYGQKPLAHKILEVRRMTELAAKQGIVTQMGIQIHASSYYRLAVQLVRDGVIGKVKTVHAWCAKAWGDTSPRPDTTSPVPPDFNWDLWLGVAAKRPFIGDGYYHPSNWRRRLDFGTGTLGDMGCHIFDPVFKALELSAPVAVCSRGPAPNPWNWAPDEEIHYQFAGTRLTAADTFTLVWYDGAAEPPAEVLALLEGDEPPRAGSIFIGTEGVMVLPHFKRPLLYPDAKFADFQYPEVGELNHWGQFIAACRGEAKTSADFAYSGPLTEAVLLGGIATHFPNQKLAWNTGRMKFDVRAANQHVRPHYRKGWSVKGLA